MAQTLHNNVFTKLAVSLSNSATSISLLDGSGFPTPAVGDFYFATLVSISGSTGKEDDWEIVKVTGKPATNTLTVTRGQEGTAARAWDAYTPCEIRITAGTVVMPDGTQNLSNKTITSSTLDSTVVGGTTAAAGSFTDLDATTVDATNVEVTNLKAKDGTAAGSIADSTGVVTVASAVLTTADINGGTVDGATIGQTTAALGTFTDMIADELQLTGGSGDQGKLSWNANENTVDLVVDAGETLQLGQEVEYNVRNNSGSSIAKGVPVMITGTLGSSGRITIDEMDATSVANDKKYLGITAEAIASGADGKVMYFGKVSGLNTSSYSAGDLLFLDTSSVGALTATEPSSGIKLGAAYVVHSHASAGVLMVRPSASVGLHDLHDVFVDSPGTGEIIRYNASNGLWETKTLAEAGIATAAQGSTADSALQNVVEDTTPQLGGNLDFNGNTATSFTSTGIDDNATSTAITIDSSQNTTFAGTINSGDITISEGTPVLRIQDSDGTNQYTQINNLNGTCYFGARNDTADGGIIVGGYGGNAFTEFARWSNSGHLTQKNNLIVQGAFTSLGIDDNATSTAITIDSSENVGINQNTPSATLDVSGSLKLSGSHPVGTRNTALGQTAFNSAQSGASYNVAVGFQSMYNNTTGTHNVGVGYQALVANTTGHSNSALGFSPLAANTTGTANSAFGYDALNANTTAANNSGFGYYALRANTTGTENTAVGYTAMDASTTASYSTALGARAAGAVTTGSYNTALGRGAFSTATTASNSVAVGNDALYSNTTGDFNHALGVVALYDNTTGENNVAVGYAALYNNTTATGNTAVGHNSCFTNETGIQLTGIGYGTLQNATASANTGVGYLAGHQISSGYYNVAIGDYALYDTQTTTNHVAVGHYALFENTTADSNTALGSTALQNTNTGSYNVGVGRQAGQANTSGALNTFVGFQTALSNTSGGANTAVGASAFGANTTASYCVAVGYQTLDANTTGARNCAVGYTAMGANTTGNYNTALGSYALFSQTTSSFNVGLGYSAGYNTTTASDNTYIGSYAGYTNATGIYNVAIGYQAAYYNTRSHNTAVGFYALLGNTTGDQNDAHGRSALQSNTTGSRNCAVGAYSLYSKTTGDNNTALGYAAGYGCTTGNNNTYVGAYNGSSGGAGYAMTSGSKNTILGSFNGNQHGLDIRTADNNIVLSDGDGNPRVVVNGSGNVGIGGTSPSAVISSSRILQVHSSGNTTLSVTSTDSVNDRSAILELLASGNGGSKSIILYGDTDTTPGTASPLVWQSYHSGVRTERMRIDSAGNLQLGVDTGTNRRFYLRASGSTSTQYACQMENSGGQNLFFVRADGAINLGEDGKSPYNDTTASAANLVINSSGFVLRSTSSARYKENIRDYDQTASIDALRPVFFNSKKEDDDKTYAGLIAEEVHEAGFTEFVEYNKDGEPDAVFYANMVALCIKEIQGLKAEVAVLKGA